MISTIKDEMDKDQMTPWDLPTAWADIIMTGLS